MDELHIGNFSSRYFLSGKLCYFWKRSLLSRRCTLMYVYYIDSERFVYPNFAVSGFIIANCILRRVTSNGYENDWAIAPAKPPAKSLAGNFKTRPPNTKIYKEILRINLANDRSKNRRQKDRKKAEWWFLWGNDFHMYLYFFRIDYRYIVEHISYIETSHFQSNKMKIQHMEPVKIINNFMFDMRLVKIITIAITIPVKVGTKPRYKPRIPPSCWRIFKHFV